MVQPAKRFSLWALEFRAETASRGTASSANHIGPSLLSGPCTDAGRSEVACVSLSRKGFAVHHDVVEYWDSPLLKVFHGRVVMKFDDPSIKPVRPTMTHFFYMDEKDPTQVKHWIGSVDPAGFRSTSARACSRRHLRSSAQARKITTAA